jgi:hypothetical protein
MTAFLYTEIKRVSIGSNSIKTYELLKQRRQPHGLSSLIWIIVITTKNY